VEVEKTRDIAAAVSTNTQLSKNKTQKTLTENELPRYKARVTKVAAFETDKGIGNRCGDARTREETGGC
jgi:hypothetical protein